jgi:hypothetical protein
MEKQLKKLSLWLLLQEDEDGKGKLTELRPPGETAKMTNSILSSFKNIMMMHWAKLLWVNTFSKS